LNGVTRDASWTRIRQVIVRARQVADDGVFIDHDWSLGLERDFRFIVHGRSRDELSRAVELNKEDGRNLWRL
jgi:hypothetical protein